MVLTERDEDDITVIDPDLFPQLATDEAEALDAIETLFPRLVLAICFDGEQIIIPMRRGENAQDIDHGKRDRRTMASSLPFPSILRTWAYS